MLGKRHTLNSNTGTRLVGDSNLHGTRRLLHFHNKPLQMGTCEVGVMSQEGQDLHSIAKYHDPHNKLTPVSSNNHMEVIQRKKFI